MLQNHALHHCKQHDVGSVWIKDEKHIKSAMIILLKTKENSLKNLYLNISDSFKDGTSELNNHSAMTVGKFILALHFEAVFPEVLRENDLNLIQCARRCFHSCRNETKKINIPFLNDIRLCANYDCFMDITNTTSYITDFKLYVVKMN